MWAVCGSRRLLTFVLPLYLRHIYKLINLIKLLLIKKCRYGISVYESIESHNVLNAIADFPGSAEPGCQRGAFAPQPEIFRIRTKTY